MGIDVMEREFPIKCEYLLLQQTPLLHFQHDQTGATLRASEVKPMLDRFIITRCGGEAAMRKDSARRNWFLGDHSALNYKMSIRALGQPEKSNETEVAVATLQCECQAVACKGRNRDGTNRCSYLDCPGPGVMPRNAIAKSYFGNMVSFRQGMTRDEKIELIRRKYKESVFYPEGVLLTVVCFDADLRRIVQEQIVPFFLVHNFGTRSNKGFGSFKVNKLNGEKLTYDSGELLKNVCNNLYSLPVFGVQPRTPSAGAGDMGNGKMLESANELYRLMKSGVNQQGDYYRSFLFQYMHKHNMGNEKAWLKQEEIAPKVGRTINVRKSESEKVGNVKFYRYVRAVLGVGDSVSFLNSVDPTIGRPNMRNGKTVVSIKALENGEEKQKFRFASPIVFKIVDEALYILPFPVNSNMFNRKFQFSSVRGNLPRTGVLAVPEQFDMVEFVSQFADYINKDCNPEVYGQNTNRRLSESRSLKFRGKISKM